MEYTQIISFIGALGIGSLIGVIVKSFFDHKLNDKKMLFDARIKAYSGITGRVFNLFLEPDITGLKNDALIFAKLNQLFSEVLLMASHELSGKLDEYKVKVYEYHIALIEKNEKNLKILHPDLVRLAGEIHIQMRRDLHVDNRPVLGIPM